MKMQIVSRTKRISSFYTDVAELSFMSCFERKTKSSLQFSRLRPRRNPQRAEPLRNPAVSARIQEIAMRWGRGALATSWQAIYQVCENPRVRRESWACRQHRPV